MNMKDQPNMRSMLIINLRTLELHYIQTKLLKDTLKEEMFDRPNRIAFEQVTYYLLNILNQRKYKQKIPWPLFSPKDSSTFRNCVRNCISELNTEYPNAEIPDVTPSLLLYPGGRNFIKFIYHLSSIALKVHCERILDLKLPSPRGSKPLPRKSKDQNKNFKVFKFLHNLIGAHISSLTENYLSFKKSRTEGRDTIFTLQNELLQLKKMVGERESELKNIIHPCPLHFQELLLDPSQRFNAIADWLEEIEEQKAVNNISSFALKKAEEKASKCYSTVISGKENWTEPLILDADNLIEQLETETVYIYAQKNNVELLKDDKFSIEGVISLGHRILQNIEKVPLKVNDLRDEPIISTWTEELNDIHTRYSAAISEIEKIRTNSLDLLGVLNQYFDYVDKVPNILESPASTLTNEKGEIKLAQSPGEDSAQFLQKLKQNVSKQDINSQDIDMGTPKLEMRVFSSFTPKQQSQIENNKGCCITPISVSPYISLPKSMINKQTPVEVNFSPTSFPSYNYDESPNESTKQLPLKSTNQLANYMNNAEECLRDENLYCTPTSSLQVRGSKLCLSDSSKLCLSDTRLFISSTSMNSPPKYLNDTFEESSDDEMTLPSPEKLLGNSVKTQKPPRKSISEIIQRFKNIKSRITTSEK